MATAPKRAQLAYELDQINSLAPKGATHVQVSVTSQRFVSFDDKYHPLADSDGKSRLGEIRIPTNKPLVFFRFFKNNGGDAYEHLKAEADIALVQRGVDIDWTEQKPEPPPSPTGGELAGPIKADNEDGRLREIEVRRRQVDVNAIAIRDQAVQQAYGKLDDARTAQIDGLAEENEKLKQELRDRQHMTLIDVLASPNGNVFVQNIGVLIGYIGTAAKKIAGVPDDDGKTINASPASPAEARIVALELAQKQTQEMLRELLSEVKKLPPAK